MIQLCAVVSHGQNVGSTTAHIWWAWRASLFNGGLRAELSAGFGSNYGLLLLEFLVRQH